MFVRYFEKKKNICVVGDEDQSIYSWRGADIRNILDFETIYKEAQVLKLEQNYRSSKNIIEAAEQGVDVFVEKPGAANLDEAKKIIENNIYGVDINPESIRVTKLALFLKIASELHLLLQH